MPSAVIGGARLKTLASYLAQSSQGERQLRDDESDDHLYRLASGRHSLTTPNHHLVATERDVGNDETSAEFVEFAELKPIHRYSFSGRHVVLSGSQIYQFRNGVDISIYTLPLE